MNNEKMKAVQTSGLKWYSRLKIFKNSRETVTFDPVNMTAYSYGWWRFVELHPKFGVIFNNYCYSVQTSKHQNKVRRVLYNLGIKVDHYIEAPRGLGDKDNAILYAYQNMFEVELALINPRRKKSLDENRIEDMRRYAGEINFLEQLGAKVGKDLLDVLKTRIEDAAINDYLHIQAKIADKEQNDIEYRANIFKRQINKIVQEATNEQA